MDARHLLPNSRPAHPPRVPLPDHVHRRVAVDRAPRRLNITKPLRGVHASGDRSVIRLHDGVHVVDRSGAATALPDAFLLHAGNRRPVAAGSVRVDDAGPRMRRIRQRLAEQAVGHRGSAPPRAHEVDRRASGIEGAGEGAPTAPDTNVGLIDTPGPLGGLEMTAQPLLQLGTGVLDPAPDGLCASSCANGRHWQRSVCASGGEPRDVFLLLLQKLHIEVAVIFEPALVGLRTQGADEP